MKDRLTALPRTVHGGTAWKMDGVEDFSHNLNPLGPPAGLDEVICNAVSGIDHYPDDSCSELKGTMSDHFGIDKECIMIGAGSSELIRSFPNVFLNSGDNVLIPRPSFAEYSQQCLIAGAKINDIILTEPQDFRIDACELVSKLSKNVKALYICNPNNPTGRIEPREKILSIVEECAERDIMVFLDETLLDLVPDHERISCVQYVKDHENLVIAGSLTKSFAIPGIRIGFGFASRKTAELMDKVRLPWNVGHIEQNVATALFRDHYDHVKKAAVMMRNESSRMYDKIKNMDFPINRTDSFFFFTSLRQTGMNASMFRDRMLTNKVMIRDCSSFGTPFEWYIRFCVKDRERNDMFIESLRRTMDSLRW